MGTKSAFKCKVQGTALLPKFPVTVFHSDFSDAMFSFIRGSWHIFYCSPTVITWKYSIILSGAPNI